MSFTLLKTKLFIPPQQLNLVPRPRLNAALETAFISGQALTLVASPAGFGKTTAVSDWIHTCTRRAAWVSLEESDNVPAVFWAYVIAALQTVSPGFAAGVSAALAETPPALVESQLPALVNALAGLDEPHVLVLDDYHTISSPAIHAQLAFLLNHPPPRLRLVIATRADPSLPLARLRGRRQLTELRAGDLRFTYEEARLLLNDRMGLGLAAEDIRLLESRTEGWSVGLLLAAQSMQGREDKREFVAAFSGSHHYVLEYLIEEVLQRQPEARRRFLLQTSILDRLCGPLCEAVTGASGGGEILAQLQKDNLFIVPLDDEFTWFRYHHLFADLLASFLPRELDPEAILVLYRRAATWYAQTGQLEKAVGYALRGRDFGRAAGWIEEVAGAMIARGQVKDLLEWIEVLPESILAARPQLLMRKGWLIFLTGRVTLALQVLKEAQRGLAGLPDSPDRDVLEGRLAAMLATLIALTRDLPGALAEANRALARLPAGEVVYLARARRVLGVCRTFLGELDEAQAQLEQALALALEGHNRFLASEILSQTATLWKHRGQLARAAETYRRILALYAAPEKAPPAGLGYIGLAEIALEAGRLAESEEYLVKGIELCRRGSIGYALQPAFLIQGLLEQARGEERAALEAVHRGEKLSQTGGGSLESILGLAWFQARLHLQRGDVEQARRWATGELLLPGWSFQDLPPVLHEIHQSLLARVHLQAREFESVLAIAAAVCPSAEAGGRMARVLELNLFTALALHGAGLQAEAHPPFERSLALAEAGGYFRLFLESGAGVPDLLRRANASVVASAYTARLLAAFDGIGPDANAPPAAQQFGPLMVENLTGRELDVLRLIGAGYSNLAIAEALVVSVNTVKKHSSNIYGKLGVRNRAQAALRARELGLI